MFSIIFIFWITLLPLVFWNGAYEGPKVFWFLIGGVGIVVFWLYRVLWKKKNFILSKIDLFYFLWLGILLISSIFGVHVFESIVGGSYRHQGVIFFFLLWLVKKTVEILEPIKRKLLMKCVAISVVLECAVVIIQLVFGKMYFGKPLGSLGEANAVAGFLVIGSFFVYEYLSKLVLLIPIIALVVTQSRTGVLAGLMIFGNLINNIGVKTKIVLWSLLFLVTSLGLMVLTGQKGNSPIENRSLVWKLGVDQIVNKPILGYGAESGEVVYETAFRNYGLPLYNLIVDRSHNLFIDVAMWSGLFGLVVFFVWLLLSYKNLTTITKKFAFFSFLIYSFFQPLSIAHWILFFLLL